MTGAIATYLGGILSWFTGGGRYMTLVHCMGDDAPWISLTIALDLTVAVGYLLIARHWGRNEAMLADGPAKSALQSMKRIFLFCGLCGYIFIPVKMFWPAWRLYDAALVVLAYYTWRYALSTQHLRVIYRQLDQTEQLTRELERSREEARRKSLFLSSISHDIRTPMNGMSLQAELAEIYRESGDDEGLRQSLAEIRACARSAADLLGEFLELGRIDWSGDSVDREPIPIDAALARVVEANRAPAERKGLTLGLDVEPGLVVHADRRMFDRILQNLVENGIKYTTSGGVRVVATADARAVEVRVVDTGVGIAEEHQPLVFQDFFQVDNRERDRSKGFGLGLSIAARLAHQLGGELRLESELGRGSRFILRLPRQAVEPSRCDAADGRPGRGSRVPAPLAR